MAEWATSTEEQNKEMLTRMSKYKQQLQCAPNYARHGLIGKKVFFSDARNLQALLNENELFAERIFGKFSILLFLLYNHAY